MTLSATRNSSGRIDIEYGGMTAQRMLKNVVRLSF